MLIATQAARPPRPFRISARSLYILFNHPLDAPDDLVQAWIVVLISGLKAIDYHVVIVSSFGMNEFMIVKRHANMGNLFAAKEDQVPGPHLGTLDGVVEEAILLIGVSGNKIAASAIAELYKAAAIDASPACAAPVIGHVEEPTSVADYRLNCLPRIRLFLLTYLQG